MPGTEADQRGDERPVSGTDPPHGRMSTFSASRESINMITPATEDSMGESGSHLKCSGARVSEHLKGHVRTGTEGDIDLLGSVSSSTVSWSRRPRRVRFRDHRGGGRLASGKSSLMHVAARDTPPRSGKTDPVHLSGPELQPVAARGPGPPQDRAHDRGTGRDHNASPWRGIASQSAPGRRRGFRRRVHAWAMPDRCPHRRSSRSCSRAWHPT